MVAVVDAQAEFLVEIRPAASAGRRPGFMDDHGPAAAVSDKAADKAGEAGADHVNLGHFARALPRPLLQPAGRKPLHHDDVAVHVVHARHH